MPYDPPAAGLAAVNAMRAAANGDTPNGRPLALDEITEEWIADTIADLLHLGVAVGLDPDEVLDHGRSYYEGDAEDVPDPGCEHRRWLNLVCLDCDRPIPAMAGSLADRWREGNPDPTRNRVRGYSCKAGLRGWVCTWSVKDHPALHIAGTGHLIAAVWPADDLPRRPIDARTLGRLADLPHDGELEKRMTGGAAK